MQAIWNLARKNVGLVIAALLTSFGADAAMANSAPFPYPTCLRFQQVCSATRYVPPTTLATEPSLAMGLTIHTFVPFTIYDASGAVECAGQLESMAVKPITPGQHYDFYYRIVKTSGPGRINLLTAFPFGPNYWIGVTTYVRGMLIYVAYRSDQPGNVRPILATRTTPDKVAFRLVDSPLSCAKHQASRFMLIRTPSFSWSSGTAVITTTTGNSTTLPTMVSF
jgi:hypothetical protein